MPPEIPEATRRAYDRATIEVVLTSKGIQQPSLNVPDNIAAIVNPAIAAELRRLAAREIDPFVIERLQLRADELDPQ